MNIGARLLFTDSGGLQEECCVVGTPCVTLRSNTERPVTLRGNGGLSELAGNDIEKVRMIARRLLNEAAADEKTAVRPPLWDGHTAERIADTFVGLAR